MSNELTEAEIRADERRKTAQYFARRMREAQRAERDGGSDARWAAYVFAETVAENAARSHAFPDSSEEG